jgi:hypothetical protein
MNNKYDVPKYPLKELENMIDDMKKNKDYEKSSYLHGLLNGCILCYAMFGGTNGEYPEFITKQYQYIEDFLIDYKTDNIQ